MTNQERRNSGSGSPPTAIMQAIKGMPWYQRFLVKAIGLTMLIGPAYVGMRVIPDLVYEGVSWMMALILLSFLGLLMFVGLLITVPKAATFIGGLIPIPAKWKRLMERPERRSR